MKRLLIAIIALLTVTCSFAQPRALGGYVSIFSDGVYYQHTIAESVFFEAQLGLDNSTFVKFGPGADLSVNINFILASVPKNNRTTNFWYGIGLHGSYGLTGLYHPANDTNPFVGIALNLGFDISFNNHLQFYTKWSPKFGKTWGLSNGYESNPPTSKMVSQFDFAKAILGIIPEFGLAYSF